MSKHKFLLSWWLLFQVLLHYSTFVDHRFLILEHINMFPWQLIFWSDNNILFYFQIRELCFQWCPENWNESHLLKMNLICISIKSFTIFIEKVLFINMPLYWLCDIHLYGHMLTVVPGPSFKGIFLSFFFTNHRSMDFTLL